MPSPELVLAGYQRATSATRASVVEAGMRLWNGMPDYRDADVDRFVARILPVVQAGKLRTALLTAAFVSATARARNAPPVPTAVDRGLILDARKVDPQVEYRRPAVAVYTALSAGKDLGTAVKEGSDRLLDLLSTDLQLSKTTQARESYQRGGYTYYRRVLTGSENCALCSIASTQRYRVRDLMPIHPGCDCGVDEVRSDWEPPQVLEPELLEATHARVEAFTGIADRGGRDPDYRKLIATRENGEWGPALVWLDQHFDGPAALD